MKLALILLSLLAIHPTYGAPARATKTKLDPVFEKFEKNWEEFKTLQAKFQQGVTSKQIPGPPDETEGTVSVARPDRVRWESTSDSSTQILNGKKVMSIRENKRRGSVMVDIYPDVTKVLQGKSIRFLTSNTLLSKNYKVARSKDDEKTSTFTLTPRSKGEETYIAEIDKSSYFLTSLTTETVDSRVVVKFLEIKLNPTLDDSLFQYEPKSSDVVTKH